MNRTPSYTGCSTQDIERPLGAAVPVLDSLLQEELNGMDDTFFIDNSQLLSNIQETELLDNDLANDDPSSEERFKKDTLSAEIPFYNCNLIRAEMALLKERRLAVYRKMCRVSTDVSLNSNPASETLKAAGFTVSSQVIDIPDDFFEDDAFS